MSMHLPSVFTTYMELIKPAFSDELWLQHPESLYQETQIEMARAIQTEGAW